MVENEKIIRAPVLQYEKSGKLVAIFRDSNIEGFVVLELSPSMGSIKTQRNPRFVKTDALRSTKYKIEVAQNRMGKEGNKVTLHPCLSG